MVNIEAVSPLGRASTPQIALTIAGLDPSGGAGITADLKTFAAHGLYGVCCPTALTVQSTQGVRQVTPVDAAQVSATLQCLADDMRIAGIKIGMLGSEVVAAAVSSFLTGFLKQSGTSFDGVVLDPVLRSSSGADLLDAEGVQVLRKRLLGQVGWITPNIDELAALLDEPVADASGVPSQAERLRRLAAQAGNTRLRVVVTGGHLERPDDYFLDCLDVQPEPGQWLRGERVETTSTHGTGCAFASALLCHVVRGEGPEQAVRHAKQYLTGALRHAYPVGSGRGPVDHFFEQRTDATAPFAPHDRSRR